MQNVLRMDGSYNPAARYTHTVTFTDKTSYFIEAVLPYDIKLLCEAIASERWQGLDKRDRRYPPVDVIHEILPDGQVIQELDVTNCNHIRLASEAYAMEARTNWHSHPSCTNAQRANY